MANDPLQSLLDYIADVKPYHTKVFEVTQTYTYNEPVKTTVKDSIAFNVIWHTLGDTDPAGFIYGGGAHEICLGIGWDTNPFDTDMWDYPYICNLSDPRLVRVTITEQFNINVSMMLQDQAITFMWDKENGWDLPPWDYTPWDLTLGAVITPIDTYDETSGATITETFVLTWSDTDGSTGTIGAEA